MERRAKIVGTLGPSSNTVEKICELITSGLNVARINMSHGTHEGHSEVIKNVRQASFRMQKELGILLDLQGPKIRVDKLAKPLELKAGDFWFITPASKLGKTKEKNVIPTVYENLVKDAHVGCTILFDDGLMEARAVDKVGDTLKIEVIIGGQLKSNKGINLPDVDVSAPSFTEKDREDLLFGLEAGVDFVALSFVRSRKCIDHVRDFMRERGCIKPIVSKVEKPEAIDNIKEIVEASDVILIARGDMGVEVGNHLVPAVQKQIIDLCNDIGRPVITATQMLESMISNSRPTRAEATDVANAIWDGTDAVMLSGETASGNYPVEAVQMMDRIVQEAEKMPKERPLLRHIEMDDVGSAVQVAASLIAEKGHGKMVICVTQTGQSAKAMSRFRPKKEVLAVSNSIEAVRKMSIYWGINPYLFDEEADDDFVFSLEHQLLDKIKRQNLVSEGDRVIITRGAGKLFSHGTSNSIRIEIIK